MTKTSEDLAERTLRWMRENLNGAYTAVHRPEHPNAGKHCTNSGTCVLVCCYVGALGKVLLKGGPAKGSNRRDFMRFEAFLQTCMNDFIVESKGLALPATPKGRQGGTEWLYEVFRCGFVHGFYPSAGVSWGRHRSLKRYWFHHRSRLTLNIDELVRGFERGLVQFQRQLNLDPDLRKRFEAFILVD